MVYDHRGLSALRQPRANTRRRVLWLAIPWLFPVPWAIHVAQVLSPTAPMQGLAKGVAAVSMFVDVFFIGIPAIILTWGWLFLAWPQHPRVCCWLAAVGIASILFAPVAVQGTLPLLIVLAMIAAIVEQAVMGHRAGLGDNRVQAV